MSDESLVPVAVLKAELPVADTVPSARTAPVPTRELFALTEPLRLVLFALGLGWGADLLFRGGEIGLGINAILWLTLWLMALWFLGAREGTRPTKRTILLFVPPLLFFGTMFAIRASAALTAYNFVACILLSLLFLRCFSTGDPLRLTVLDCVVLPFRTFGGALALAPPVLRAAMSQVSPATERRERWKSLGRGILFAVPTLCLFTALFSSADKGFAQYVNDVLTWLFPSDWVKLAVRFWWGLLIAFLCTGGIAAAIRRGQNDIAVETTKSNTGVLGFTEASIILGSVITLFASFLVTQIPYLFGGDALVQSTPNLTYKDYVHSGFAELNTAAVVTLLLIAGLNRIVHRATAIQEQLFSGLGTGLLTLTLPLLVSSFSRMQGYEAACGATELRLYVDLFIGWLAVGLIWRGVMLWRKSLAGGLGLYLCAVGFLVSLNLINPDAAITRRNAERYEKTGHLDLSYLASLSDDAVPEMVRLRDIMEHDRNAVGNGNQRGQMEELLRHRAQGNDGSTDSWMAWNVAHAQARQLLKPYRITKL